MDETTADGERSALIYPTLFSQIVEEKGRNDHLKDMGGENKVLICL